MQRAKINTETVYGHRVSKYAGTAPLRVLNTRLLWSQHLRTALGSTDMNPVTVASSSPVRTAWRATGLLAVRVDRFQVGKVTETALLELSETLDSMTFPPYEHTTAWRDMVAAMLPSGMTLVIVQPREIHDTWAMHAQAKREALESQEKRQVQVDAHNRDYTDRWIRMAAALEERGVRAPHLTPYTSLRMDQEVTLTLADMERVLGLWPSGNPEV